MSATGTAAPEAVAPRTREAGGARRAGRTRLNHYRFAPLVLVAVNVVLFAVFFVWPAVIGLIYSFTDYTGVGSFHFIGLSNYEQLFGDSAFYAALGRTLLFTLLVVPTSFVFSLLVANLMVSRFSKGKLVARIIFFVPWLISPIVSGVPCDGLRMSIPSPAALICARTLVPELLMRLSRSSTVVTPARSTVPLSSPFVICIPLKLMPAPPRRLATEATNTSRPLSLLSRSPIAAWAQSKAAVRLVATIRSQLSRVILWNGALSAIPALTISRSIGPFAARASSKAAAPAISCSIFLLCRRTWIPNNDCRA